MNLKSGISNVQPIAEPSFSHPAEPEASCLSMLMYYRVSLTNTTADRMLTPIICV
jgi:hypothetical protein